MNLPDLFQRQPAQDVVEAGATVAGVDPEIAEVEQDAAAGLVGDRGEEIAVWHLPEAGGEVVHAGFKRERQSDGRGSGLNIGNDQGDGGVGLQWRHQEAARARPIGGRDFQDAEMFAGPWRGELVGPPAQFPDMRALVADGRAHGVANAVQQLALGQACQFPQADRAAARTRIRGRALDPLCLRLDFRDLQQVGMGPKHWIEWREIDCPGAERLGSEDDRPQWPRICASSVCGFTTTSMAWVKRISKPDRHPGQPSFPSTLATTLCA